MAAARVGAVVLALGVLAYLVTSAHRGAQSPPGGDPRPSPVAPGSAPIVPAGGSQVTPFEEHPSPAGDPGFLRSSKFLVLEPAKTPRVEGPPEVIAFPPDFPGFLPSSKSGRVLVPEKQ